MKVSIIIPTHNEEKRISKTLESYLKFFKDLKNKKILDFRILVVINNTKDKTEEIVKECSKKNKEVDYLNFKEGGKGFAIIEGFKDALKRESELIGFVDADLATSPESFYDLVKNIEYCDGVIASRRKRGAVIKYKSLTRRIMSFGFNALVRFLFLFPYEDTQCGAKLFKKEVIKKVLPELKSMKWAFDVDLLYIAKRRGFKIIGIPTTWEDRAGSKLNFKKVPFQMFSAIIRLRLIYSPFKFIIRLYDKLPEKMKIHNL